MNIQRIEITTKTLVTITIFFVALWVLVQISQIILILFIAFILMSALRPLVEHLQKIRIPRVPALLIVYLSFIGILGLGIAFIAAPLIDETIKLITELPDFYERLVVLFNLDPSLVNPSLLQNQLGSFSSNLLRLTVGIVDNIISIISLLVITFYLLLERQRIENYLTGFLTRGQQERTVKLLRRVEDRLGDWARGQLVLAVVVGVFSYFGLTLLKVDFALPLALVAGIMEILPVIGPIISGIPAVIVALTTSPILGLAVVALYFIIQQIENNVLVPKVMQKMVGLNPLVTIISIAIGAKLMGVVGALLAVPLVVVAQIIIGDILKPTSTTSSTSK